MRSLKTLLVFALVISALPMFAASRGNAKLVGLTSTPLDMTIRRASFNGNTATISLVAGTCSTTLAKAISEATLKGTYIGTLVVQSGGQQWSFSKTMFTSTSFPQGQDFLFTFQFDSMVGSAATFNALGGN